MYILVVSRGFPTEKYKMNGIFEFDQAKALVEAGHKVVFAAVDLRSIRRWRRWGIEKRIIEGLPIYAINIPLGRITKWLLQKAGTLGLEILYDKIVEEQGKPDVIHAHFARIGYVASRHKLKTNLPLVVTEHLSTLMKPTIDENLYHTASQTYEQADALIAVSPALRDIIKERFDKDALYVPNIVDTRLFNYSQRKDEGVFRFISVGSLIIRKRMDLTIEAFVKAFQHNDKVTLTIFGDGPERPRLENLIQKYNVQKKVRLMGLQAREQIAEHLKQCDCFVLASQAETFGVSYIEALATGIPVIATRCGGPEGFVTEKNGVFVPIDDVQGLKDAMRYIFLNTNRYDRELIAEETSKQFSRASISVRLTEIYNQLISKRDNI